jgi:hypothetical protein
MMNYHIYEGSVDKSIKHSNFVVFRGADTKQIGGVGSWGEYEKYENRLNKEGVMQKEIEKNKRRIQLLIKAGIIPKEVVNLVP